MFLESTGKEYRLFKLLSNIFNVNHLEQLVKKLTKNGGGGGGVGVKLLRENIKNLIILVDFSFFKSIFLEVNCYLRLIIL